MNRIALITTTIAVDHTVRYLLKKRKTDISVILEINEMLFAHNQELCEALSYQVAANTFMSNQNDYMAHMLDRNNVPITEFDTIAMANPIIISK